MLRRNMLTTDCQNSRAKGRHLVFTLPFFQKATTKTHGLTVEITAKPQKIACNWSSWASHQKNAEARVALEKSIALDNGNWSAVFLLAQLQGMSGEDAAAAANYERIHPEETSRCTGLRRPGTFA